MVYKIEFGQRIYYYLWQIKAWRVARRLHKEMGFDIAHHVTFGNDWIASYIGAFLPVPFICGPVGGQRTPRQLWSEYTAYGRFAEAARNIAQWFGRRDPDFAAARSGRRGPSSSATTKPANSSPGAGGTRSFFPGERRFPE